jgi:hypothetical protein
MGERDQDDRTQSLRKSVMLRSIDLGENPPMSGGELAVFPDRESPEVLINRYFYTEHIHWDSEKARGMESAAGRSDPRWGRGAPGLHSRSSRSRPSLHRIRGDRAPGDRLNVKPPRYPAAPANDHAPTLRDAQMTRNGLAVGFPGMERAWLEPATPACNSPAGWSRRATSSRRRGDKPFAPSVVIAASRGLSA